MRSALKSLLKSILVFNEIRFSKMHTEFDFDLETIYDNDSLIVLFRFLRNEETLNYQQKILI